jgi:type I restriction enzyme, R subunit
MAEASPNFDFLAGYDPLLVTFGTLAERYYADDPNTALIKLRQFGELLASEAAARSGVLSYGEAGFADVLESLRYKGVLNPQVADLFHGIRKAGNNAVHHHTGTPREALHQLKMAWKLGIWFHRSFGGVAGFKPGPFVPPAQPHVVEAELAEELQRLRDDLDARKEEAEAARAAVEEEARRRREVQAAVAEAQTELEAAMALAEESEEQLLAERRRHQAALESMQAQAAAAPAEQMEMVVQHAQQAAEHLDLDEADTRKIIDAQLREAGWEADTQALAHKKGVRPQKGKNLAIAEWPTTSGPADYVLFVGLTPVAVVEAKRKAKDVPGAIQQAKRYSRDYVLEGDEQSPGGPWGEYWIPFLFATNGRPFLRQLQNQSGIHFLDARRSTNHPRALEGWKTPEGLAKDLPHEVEEADEKLAQEDSSYLDLRYYQHEAVRAVEKAIASDQRDILIAMATGTGKTRTCIGLVYRLIKAGRFRRVLFLVDRSALGEQAANAFKDVRLENLQTFTDIYDVKELGDLIPESDTRLHIATIQGMMKRLLYPSDESQPLPVDQYDCIVIDECHRGYNLDREMSDAELSFRSEADYISKYRRVLDHFDAVRVGLTATPALHTTEIFGKAVYQYSYRKAVIDGYLVDHEPPTRIVTALAEDGMTWKVGEAMEVYHTRSDQLDLFNVPDEVTMEVEQYNKRVVTENFNRVVCGVLARHIDPSLPGKTLIFAANDRHADLVVGMLKNAFEDGYGPIDDDLVQKITGAADKPSQLIRNYKNERLPKVAVTVDLLTTGIDVPEITNIVFVRRVRSRILYEQMMGRATRLCPDIGKEFFRIFDAVDLYSTLEPVTSMKPVVASPKTTFVQLVKELSDSDNKDWSQEICDQLVAKLQRKKKVIEDRHLDEFTHVALVEPAYLLRNLLRDDPDDSRSYFEDHSDLARWLDDLVKRTSDPRLIISHHEDQIRSVERGYGGGNLKPQDYLESFKTFIEENKNRIPALLVVLQRPRDLTRQQLKELKLELDSAGYNELSLRTAWRDATNEEIAASIIGFIRRQALGSPLLPYEKRVGRAMARILSSQSWTGPQRKWLKRIGDQLLVPVPKWPLGGLRSP